MVTILPKEDQWGDIGRSIGAGAGEGYINRSDEMALQKAMGALPPNATPRQILDAVTNTRTHSPQAKQNLLSNYLGVEQFEELKRHAKATEEEAQAKRIADQEIAKQKKVTDLNDSLALIQNSELPADQKEDLADQVAEGKVSYRAIEKMTKPVKPTKAPTNDFQKGLAKEHVKQYVDAEKSIVQSERNLKDLARIEELDKKLSGPIGYFNALNPFNEESAELSALGFGVIEPIVKIFNPSGPIAQKKLEQLQNRYGIQATDSSAKIRGKVAALKRYANYAKQISEARIALFKEHDGNPPLGELARLDAIGDQIVDQMEKEDPTQPKIYYSVANGKPVKAQSLEQQEELIRKGLITDVKPQ